MRNNNAANILTTLMMICLLVGCSTMPKTQYIDMGLNFKVTPEFRIGRSNTYKKNQSTYIPIVIRDRNLYAKFSIVWLPGHSDLDWEIWNYSDALNSVYDSDTQNKPTYSEIKSTKFGSHDARQVDYIVPDDGPRVGSYTVFYCDSVTVIIGQHSTMESQSVTLKCRKLIEESFTCMPVRAK